MQKLDSRFHLRGRPDETIRVTVNGQSQLAGVMCVLGDVTVADGQFALRAGKPMMLAVNIDFNQAEGDTFEIEVKGDPEGFVSKCPVPRAGAFRTVHYRFHVE
jgi:hypothetical protein